MCTPCVLYLEECLTDVDLQCIVAECTHSVLSDYYGWIHYLEIDRPCSTVQWKFKGTANVGLIRKFLKDLTMELDL